MNRSRKAKLSLASIFFTFFIDNLSWSIVFPIFAPYFVDVNNQLFSPSVSEAARSTLLGLFLMAFSLGQFLGAPLIGEYADRHGRKRALLLSVFFTCVGFALSAWSMEKNLLIPLFLGRLMTGLFAGNMAICLACITDLNEEEKMRVKYFGYLSLLTGISFVVGAFLGGQLSDPSISSYFTPSFPLQIAAGMSLLNLLFVFFFFRETAPVDPERKFDFFESFHNIKIALRTEKIKGIYGIYFLFIFAWTILIQFIPVIVVDQFEFTNSNIGDLALYMGLCWAIGSGYLNKFLLKYFPSVTILEACLIAFTLLCALVILPNQLYWVLSLLGLAVIVGGLSWPHCTGLISKTAPQEIQGKILGMSQSIQSLAMAIAPLVGGLCFHLSSSLPFFIGALASFCAAVLYYIILKKR